jgi:tetratricopeptide (TPR) repeat protein
MDTRKRPWKVWLRTKRLLPLLLIMATPGCTPTGSADATLLLQANQAYRTADFVGAERNSDQYLSAAGSGPNAAEAYYIRALSKIRRNQRSAARTDLNEGLSRQPHPDVRGRINAQLGHLSFDDQQYSLARSYYSAALKDLPPRSPSDDVLYHLAVAYQRDGQFQKAKPLFEQLVARFPASEWTPKARNKSQWTNPFFTIQCGAFVSRAAAQRSVSRLRSRGVDAALVSTGAPSSRHQLVCAGRYRTYNEAAGALHRIRRIQRDAFIVP